MLRNHHIFWVWWLFFALTMKSHRKWLRIQGLLASIFKFFGCFQSKDEKLNLFSTHAKDVEAGETKTIRINENLRYLLLAGGPKMWVFHIQAFVYALEFTSLILSSHKATRLTCEGQGWSSLILLTIIWKPFGYSEPWNLNHCPSNLVNLTIPFWLFFSSCLI